MPDVTITTGGPADIDRLEPLWDALFEHHRACEPAAADVRPFRSGEESWRRRRGRYETWVQEEGAALLLASRDERLVGYAFVRIRGGEATLETGARMGELETLSVLPEERGAGIGTALMEAVHAHLRANGVREIGLGVMDGNAGAQRLYERLGLRPYVLLMLGEVPGSPGT